MTTRTEPVRPTPRFTSTLASEWVKLWSMPGTYVFLAVTAALTVGISSLVILFDGAESMANAQQSQKYEIIFFGANLGVMAFGALAAAFVTVENRTGMLTYSLVATPRRWRVLAAKLVIITSLGVVVGAVISFANFAVSQSVLGAVGEPTLHLGDGGLLRSVALFVPLSMLVHAVLAVAAAVLLRNAPGAVVLVFAIDALPVWIAGYLGGWFATTVPRHLPGAVVENIAGISGTDSAAYLPPVPAALTVLAWLVVALWLAFTVFTRRDS